MNACRNICNFLHLAQFQDNTDIDRAEQILNEDHYSLEVRRKRAEISGF